MQMTESEVQQLLAGTPLSFECPTCEANAFEACKSPASGLVYKGGFIHARRRRAAGETTHTPWGDGTYPRYRGKNTPYLCVPCEHCNARINESCKSPYTGAHWSYQTHKIRREHAGIFRGMHLASG